MLAVMTITAPIFVLLGVGFLASQRALLSRQQVQGLGHFVITFALPALILKALLDKPLQEIFDLNYLLAYGLASLGAFWLIFLYARFVRCDSLAGSTLSGLGSSMSNSGFIGYPIVVMAIGPSAALGLALCMLVENLLMLPMALAMAEMGEQNAGQKSLVRLLRDIFYGLLKKPLIIAMLLGAALSLLGVRPPAFIMKAVDMLASASAPMAIFVIGASLQGFQGRQLLPDILPVTAGKLLLHPVLLLLCFAFLPVDPLLKVAGVLFACAPMLSIFPIVGQRFGLEARCAATLVATTVCSFMTISFFVWVLV